MSRVIIKPNFTAGNVNLTPPEEFAKKFTPEYINELKEQAMSRQKEVTFDNAKTLEEKCIAIWFRAILFFYISSFIISYAEKTITH